MLEDDDEDDFLGVEDEEEEVEENVLEPQRRLEVDDVRRAPVSDSRMLHWRFLARFSLFAANASFFFCSALVCSSLFLF